MRTLFGRGGAVGLVEITMAMLVLAVGGLPVVRSLVEGVRDVQSLQERSVASCVAQSVIERLRRCDPAVLAEVLPAALPAQPGDSVELLAEIDAVAADGTKVPVRFVREASYQPATTDKPAVLTCRISWVERAANGRRRSLCLSTLVVDR